MFNLHKKIIQIYCLSKYNVISQLITNRLCVYLSKELMAYGLTLNIERKYEFESRILENKDKG